MTLPSLESLLLSKIVQAAGAVTGLLTAFVVPALLRFEVPESFLLSAFGSNPLDLLRSFISTPDCKIQEICITGYLSRICFPVSESEYCAAFPSVPKFSFDYDESDDDGNSDY
jgi:hypothetical protein